MHNTTVERFTGDLKRVNAFLLRYEGHGRRLGHWQTFSQTDAQAKAAEPTCKTQAELQKSTASATTQRGMKTAQDALNV